MGMPRINYSAPFTRSVSARGVFASCPFVLADVGASGGIEDYWRVFQPHLKAFGFDPLLKEVERLNQIEQSEDVRYYPYFVGEPSYEQLFPPALSGDPVLGWSDEVYERTSAVRAQQILSMSFTQRFNNEDPEILITDKRTSLDNFFSRTPTDTVDFIKVDTDGHDYEVLLGARQTMAEKQVLGFLIECQLHGVAHQHSNVFSNIDRLMRQQGFSLFDFEIYRYTRAALPGHFVYDIPAQTHEGQVVWGDALYLRDVTARGYEDRWGSLDNYKLLKLACIEEIFGLPDCAAEVLQMRRDVLEADVDIQASLNVLAHEMDPASTSFREHNQKFQSSPKAFYPAKASPSAVRLQRPGLRGTLGRLRRLLGA
jgi:FkbM family methyltransferase